MRFEEDVYAAGKQCLKGVLLAFIAAGVFLATYKIMWEWFCISVIFLLKSCGDVLVFIFPILPATCFILMGFIFWLSCLTIKLSNMNKLTKSFWLNAVKAHVSSLLLLIVLFIAWMSISNSGETTLKGAAIIGLIASLMATMVIAMAYDDQEHKPKIDEE
jgi:hypothetical protein